jgi:hypothetical protein
MANTVTKWKSGQNPVPGTPSVGFPYCDFTWNVGSGTDHAEILSEPFAYPGRYFTFVINTEGASISSSTTAVWKLYGANSSDLADAKWDFLVQGSISNVQLDDVAAVAPVGVETAGDAQGVGICKYYRIGIDPNQDPGVDYSIRVGLNTPPVGSDA